MASDTSDERKTHQALLVSLRSLDRSQKRLRKTACIYIQTDRVDNIIRIGKAEKGFEARYRGGTGYAIDAAMHGSGNAVFVTSVPQRLCSTIELQLIWQLRSQLDYNRQGKLRQPNVSVSLIHTGEAPAFVGSERRPRVR